jgi:hypothetical protein
LQQNKKLLGEKGGGCFLAKAFILKISKNKYKIIW